MVMVALLFLINAVVSVDDNIGVDNVCIHIVIRIIAYIAITTTLAIIIYPL